MDTLWQDLKHGARTLLRSPGFTAAAVLTLGLGIGASTTIFSVVNAVLLRPLPVREPERLVRIFEANPSRGWDAFTASMPNYHDWVEQAVSFEHLGALQGTTFNLTGSGDPERVVGAFATASLFPAFGVTPAVGRGFLPEEDRPGAARVVVLSNGLWVRRFGADPALVGRTIQLGGESHTVVGVLPADFGFTLGSELWVPLAREVVPADRANHVLAVFGRLRSGVTLEQASADLEAIARRLEQAHPGSNTGWGVRLRTVHDWIVPEPTRRSLAILLAAVGFVLLIACANVANLLLARAEPARRALAVRAALGAGRGRILRQLLTESLLLAGLGGAAGLLLALWGTELIAASAAPRLPRLDETRLDGLVLGFTLLVSLATALLFGALPAWQGSRSDLAETLRRAGRGTVAGRPGLRGALVVVEVALTLTLLAGAGLMIRSLARLQQVPLGFRPEGVQTAQLALSPAKYPEREQRVEFFERLLARVRAVPGVTEAAAITQVPFSGGNWAMEITLQGREAAAETPLSADARAVTRGYFRTMGIPLLAGRDFGEQDRGDAPLVLIVSQGFARRFWPGEDPLGKQFRPGARNPFGTVVGVVGDVRNLTLADEARPAFYFAHGHIGMPAMTLVLRAGAAPGGLAPTLRAQVQALDTDLPVFNVREMPDMVRAAAGEPQFQTALFGLFGALALLLAAVGIYAVIAFAVAQRTQEIGIRMALGAGSRDVRRLVVAQGMRWVLPGLVLGSAGALALGRSMRGLLFAVAANDPTTLLAVILLLAAVAFAACYVPARRATKVDPLIALRYE